MNRNTWLAIFASALVPACDGGLDTTRDDETGATVDPALGTVSLSLEADPGLALEGLSARLVFTPGAGQAVTVERPISGTGFTELVRLPPGVYAVAVSLLETQDGAVAYSGQATGVQVTAGLTTALAVPVTPTGGVQVSVRLPTLGGDWACAPSVDVSALPSIGSARNGLFGAQRVERVGGVWTPTYYLWACGGSGCRLAKTSTVDGTKSPVWLFAEAAATNLSMYGDRAAVWATGSGFFALADGVLLESADGVAWAATSEQATSFTRFQVGASYSLGGDLRGCAVVVDDATRTFCQAYDTWIGTTGVQAAAGLVVGSSPDGLAWDAYPPALEGEFDRTREMEVAFATSPPSTVPPQFWEHGRQLVGAFLHGGVYHAIFVELGNGSPPPGGSVASQPPIFHGLGRYESTDGELWGERTATRCTTMPTPARRSAWATFVVDGTLHLYYPIGGASLGHITSVK